MEKLILEIGEPEADGWKVQAFDQHHNPVGGTFLMLDEAGLKHFAQHIVMWLKLPAGPPVRAA